MCNNEQELSLLDELFLAEQGMRALEEAMWKKYVDEDEGLTEEESQNLDNYFASANADLERERDWPAFPINDEYCWSHHDKDGMHMGGWCCQHEDCKKGEAQEFACEECGDPSCYSCNLSEEDSAKVLRWAFEGFKRQSWMIGGEQ